MGADNAVSLSRYLSLSLSLYIYIYIYMQALLSFMRYRGQGGVDTNGLAAKADKDC